MSAAGHGRFPLSLAAKFTKYNVLGVDIRQKVSCTHCDIHLNSATTASGTVVVDGRSMDDTPMQAQCLTSADKHINIKRSCLKSSSLQTGLVAVD